jgi:hypothetical protein
VLGTFQIKIPVSTAETMLPAEQNTLAIFKWRLRAMHSSNPWHPVLERYVSIISARVAGLGGRPEKIQPSLCGAAVEPEESREPLVKYCGKVKEVLYDCFGDFEGFVLHDCNGPHILKTRENRIEKIAMRACETGSTLAVYVGQAGDVRKLAVRG